MRPPRTKNWVRAALEAGPQRLSYLRLGPVVDEPLLSPDAVRSAIARLRLDGWDIRVKRMADGDPKYELFTAKGTP